MELNMHLKLMSSFFLQLMCSISVCHYRMQDWVTYLIGKSVQGHEQEASETRFFDSRVM